MEGTIKLITYDILKTHKAQTALCVIKSCAF